MLTIRKIDAAPARADDVAAALDAAGVEFNAIGCVNWPHDFPYAPRAEFRLAHTGSELLIDYRVAEHSVAAVAQADGGPVWEDSCCELFLQPTPGGPYYNIECNCAGTLLIACGPGREGREPAPQGVLQSVRRWSSLGREPFAERVGDVEWHLSLIVPTTAFFRHDIATFSGEMMGNAYKCGDRLQRPHFLSWAPIPIAAPDFHRPDHFAPMQFVSGEAQ